MPALKDLTGKRFGRLLVIRRQGTSKHKKPLWLCVCDCGNYCIKESSLLLKGKTTSCGCYHKETVKGLFETHCMSKTRLHKLWLHVKERCFNKNSKAYKYYGGRGITVCDEWRDDFQAFYDWAMKNGYDETAPRGQCTIDRIDVDGNYKPDNCRFVSEKTQANNKTNNVRLTHNGETHTLAEWSDILNINYQTLCGRLQRGLSTDKVLSATVKNQKKYLYYKGQTKYYKEWAIEYGLSSEALRSRLKRGWEIERALTTPMKLKESYNG